MSDTNAHLPLGATDGRLRGDLLAVGILILVFAGLFGPLIVAKEPRVLSHHTGDTAQFFIPMREFAADEISAGRLPLWNPYLMSGTSFIGNFQSAMFYPPNAIYLLMDTNRAVDLDYALHYFLLALFMFAWARVRGISPPGSLLAAFAVAFSAPIYFRMLGGQLTMVDAMAWAPLLFLCIDRIFDRAADRGPLLGWVLLGAAAVGLQILAGHPQTVFITGMTAAMYCAVRFPGAARRIRATAAFAAVGMWGVALSAIQLLPGLETMGESLRTGGINAFDFSTTFSFPPENLLNLIAPAFFGDRVHLTYWGRWAIWDAAVFMGVTGFVLAVYGAKYAGRRERRYAPFLVLLLVLIAMGRYSPVYNVFSVVPIFGSLRGVSKFLFLATMFAGILCGAGFDRLTADAGTTRPRRAALLIWSVCPAIALGIGTIAFTRFTGGGEEWREALFRNMNAGLFAFAWFSSTDDYFRAAAWWAMGSLAVGMALLALIAALFWHAQRGRRVIVSLLALGCLEMTGFAAMYRVTFDPSILAAPASDRAYAERGDYRVLHFADPAAVYHRNVPMRQRRPAVWGYEPVMLKRYGMLIAGAAAPNVQQLNVMLDHIRWGSDVLQIALNGEYVDFEEDPATGRVTLPNHLNLARCRYVIVPDGMPHTQPGIYENSGAMPRFNFLGDYLVMTNARSILQTIGEVTFDPRRVVILEERPAVEPVAGGEAPNAMVAVEDETTDHVTLFITLDRPSILLITDPISAGWRISALEDNDQSRYDLLPADLAFRAVPLTAGTHHFRMEYRPRSFDLGLRVTFAAMIAFAAALVYWGTLAAGAQLAKKAR